MWNSGWTIKTLVRRAFPMCEIVPGGWKLTNNLNLIVLATTALLLTASVNANPESARGPVNTVDSDSEETKPTPEVNSSKLYKAVSGYMKGYHPEALKDESQDPGKHRQRRQITHTSPSKDSQAATTYENEKNLANSRIQRREWGLAIISLERALKTSEGTADPREVAKIREMLEQVRLKVSATRAGKRSPIGEIVNSIGMRMILIRPGSFVMGSSSADIRRVLNDWNVEQAMLGPERPAHTVQISSPYFLGQYEVTVGQFKRFVEETGYRTVAETQGWGWVYDSKQKHWARKQGASWRHPGRDVWDDHPVSMVCHKDAEAFCRWLSSKEGREYYLPTEAQWEFAARSGREGERFPWGQAYPDGKQLNLADRRSAMPWADRTIDDGHAGPAPVGSYEPTGFWLYDIMGNVWEMCSDFYNSRAYESARSDKVTDPAGPARGKKKVVRGGNWAFGAGIARNAFRFAVAPDLAVDVLGFRVAATATDSESAQKNTSESLSTKEAIKRDGIKRLMGKIKNLIANGRRLEARRLAENLPNADPGREGSIGDPDDFVKEVLKSLIDLTAEKGQSSFKNSLGMEMVHIPAGSFVMGSSESDIAWAMTTLNRGTPVDLENEYPFHKVRISRPFLISSTEVTVRQFREFVKSTGYVTDAEDAGGGQVFDVKEGRFVVKAGSSWKNPGWPVKDDQPVTMISFYDAQAFVEWLSAKEKLPYKLPTEAQWEYAARGGLPMNQFPWGDTLPDGGKANYADSNTDFEWRDRNADDGYRYVSPVATYEPNGFGLYDMAGNVLEWVRDHYGRDYYRYSPEIDPEGPGHGENRVMKGGEWTFGPVNLRCAFRGWSRPELAFFNSGFRVAIVFGNRRKTFHFSNSFLTRKWVPRQDHREVARAVAAENLRREAVGPTTDQGAPKTDNPFVNGPSYRGVKILAFTPKSDAAKAGLNVGDIIIEYDGNRNLGAEKLIALSAKTDRRKRKPQLIIVRDGYLYSVQVDPGFLGITVMDTRVRGPFKTDEGTRTRERDDKLKKRSKPLNWT
jgi:formylglycine-generating enzyme required for sulfatase activity